MSVVVTISSGILMTFVTLLTFGVLPGVSEPSPFSIIIEDDPPYFFTSNTIATPGAPIRLENRTAFYHSIISDGCVVGSSCAFESKSIAPNAIYTLQGLPPGRYAYHCVLHPIMRGELVVSDPSAITAGVLRIASP